MKFIEKIDFSNPAEIKDSLSRSLVVHVIPKTNPECTEKFYSECIQSIGVPFLSEEDFLTNNKTGKLWSNIQYNPSKSKSFSHSDTRQPFHTDGAYEKNAPDISFFYCVEQALFGGATTFVSLETLLNCLNHYDKNLLSDIKSVEMNFFKGNDSKKSVILDEKNNITWNYFRVEKNKTSERFHSFLEEKIYQGGLYRSIYLQKNEALFFWDSKVLHGRNSFVGNRSLRKAGIHVV